MESRWRSLAIEIGLDEAFGVPVKGKVFLAARHTLFPSIVITNQTPGVPNFFSWVISPPGTGLVTGRLFVAPTSGLNFPYHVPVNPDH